MKKFFSLFAAMLFAGSMMAGSFAPKALADITAEDVVIVTIDNGSGVFAMSNDNGTSNPPKAVAVTVEEGKISTDETNILWTIQKDGDNLSFKAGEEAFLYCTNTNNGVRVGANAGTFIINDDYLSCTSTSSKRYIGVYNSSDFRCYTTINSNIKDQTLAFYVKEDGGDEPAEDTWTVAGNPASVFGTAWAPANKANDMVKQEDGSFKWEKTDLELAAGKVEFKVVKNHSWDEAYPSENYELNIAEVGKYTITITFNPESHEVTANAEKTGEAEVDPTAAVRGSFNGWEGGDMTLAEDKKSASLTIALEEKEYEFKMVINDAWLGNGYTFHRDFTSVEGLTENGENMKLQADVAGDYTITWTFESNKMEIAFPKKPEVLPEGAFKLTFNGTGTGSDDSGVLAATVEAVFTADCQAKVASVDALSNVYPGRNIAEETSLKFGTSSKKGALTFTLATPVEVDSIIVNATQYGNDAAEVTVNGVKFDLIAGNKVPTDCKLVPNGEISQITIEQTGSQRIYLRSVKVFAKTGEVPPVDKPKFYVTGNDALVGEKAWNPAAIESMTDTLSLNLEAGVDYLVKVTLNGTWEGENNVKGYNELTEKAEGLQDVGDDHNIGFKLNEAGVVKVVYIAAAEEQPEVFKLIGNFSTEVPPVVLPVVAIAGAMNDWNAEANILGPEEGDEKASAKIALEAQDYNFKVVVDGQWRCYKDQVYDITRENATLPGINDEGGYNDNFNLKADVAGEYTFTWIYATNTLEITFPEDGPVPPVDEPKFYITGTANLVGEESAWKPDALPVKEESVVLPLEPGDYMMKITLKGNWEEGVLGFDELTGEIPAGVTRGQDGDDNNILFTLDEAGDVTVTYTGEAFTIAGKFHTDEPVDEPKFYITGTANLVGEESAWKPDALPVKEESVVLPLEPGDYMMKITLKGNWEEGVLGFDELTGEIPAGVTRGKDADDNNILFTLAEAGDVTITYTGETFTIAGNFYVEPAGDPTVTVIGDMTEWAAEIPFTLSEDKKTATLYNDNIKAGTYEFKLKVNGEWRSNGYTFHRDFTSAEGITENLEANMVVIIDVEGEYTFTWTFETNKLEITFPEKGEGIEEILSEGKAVKVLHEGKLLIMKGNHSYTPMGQIVK